MQVRGITLSWAGTGSESGESSRAGQAWCHQRAWRPTKPRVQCRFTYLTTGTVFRLFNCSTARTCSSLIGQNFLFNRTFFIILGALENMDQIQFNEPKNIQFRRANGNLRPLKEHNGEVFAKVEISIKNIVIVLFERPYILIFSTKLYVFWLVELDLIHIFQRT